LRTHKQSTFYGLFQAQTKHKIKPLFYFHSPPPPPPPCTTLSLIHSLSHPCSLTHQSRPSQCDCVLLVSRLLWTKEETSNSPGPIEPWGRKKSLLWHNSCVCVYTHFVAHSKIFRKGSISNRRRRRRRKGSKKTPIFNKRSKQTKTTEVFPPRALSSLFLFLCRIKCVCACESESKKWLEREKVCMCAFFRERKKERKRKCVFI
jgi:hypothetical protein